MAISVEYETLREALFRAAFLGQNGQITWSDKPLVEMSPELIDELAARILQFTLQLHDNGLRADAPTVERGGKRAENFYSAAKKRSKSVIPGASRSDSSALHVPLEQM